MEEKELIDKLKCGDKHSQEEFVKKYSSFLFNVAVQILRRKDLAEDAVEDALLTALTKIESFKGKARLSTWLYRIVTNRAKQIILKEMKNDSLKNKISSIVKDDGEYIPSEYKKNKEKEIIWHGMDFLNDMEREIITLVDIEGLKYEEVAEVLGVPIGTVRSRISRAREHLKNVIVQRNFFEEDVSNK